MTKTNKNITWWLRMQPRSIMKTIEYVKYFSKFENENWNFVLEDCRSSYKSQSIHPIRRKYIYLAHSESLEAQYPTLECYLNGQFDINETESRGRNEKKSFEFYGLAYVKENGIIKLTKTGELIRDGLIDEDIMLRQLLKLQFPSPVQDKDFNGDYIFPLELTLEIFNYFQSLNRFEIGFLFGCVNLNDIDITINAINNFRERTKNLSLTNNLKEVKKIFSDIFFEKYNIKLSKPETYYSDYSDAFARCLEYTGLFSQKGRGLYQKVYIPEYAKIKIDMLKKEYKFKYNSEHDLELYMDYYGNPFNISLPWDKIENKKIVIINKIDTLKDKLKEANSKIKNFNQTKYNNLLVDIEYLNKIDINRLEKEITETIIKLNEELFVHYYSKTNEVRQEILNKFIDINKGKAEDASLWLECNTWRSLVSINGNHLVKRNFKVEEDLSPKAFAPGIGNTPDMELYSTDYILIPEVSLMTGVKQWEHEGSSVIEHVLKFINNNENKDVYGIFICSQLNIRTLWQFFILNKESWIKKPIPVIPLTIQQYVDILEYIYTREKTIDEFKNIIHDIHKKTFEFNNYEEWQDNINKMINSISNNKP